MMPPRLPVLAAALLALAACSTARPTESVTADIVWQPGMSGFHMVREGCRAASGQALVDCFADGLGGIGAPEAAVAFAKRLPQPGFARDFRPAGPVAIAYVLYPYRANENQAWLVVNGDPPLIDLDDPALVDLDRLRDAPAIRPFARSYPGLTLWPGDRSGTSGPQVRPRPDGGVGLVVTYELHDGCHACAVVGLLDYGFDFDAEGRLTGSGLVSVRPHGAAAPG